MKEKKKQVKPNDILHKGTHEDGKNLYRKYRHYFIQNSEAH